MRRVDGGLASDETEGAGANRDLAGHARGLDESGRDARFSSHRIRADCRQTSPMIRPSPSTANVIKSSANGQTVPRASHTWAYTRSQSEPSADEISTAQVGLEHEPSRQRPADERCASQRHGRRSILRQSARPALVLIDARTVHVHRRLLARRIGSTSNTNGGCGMRWPAWGLFTAMTLPSRINRTSSQLLKTVICDGESGVSKFAMNTIGPSCSPGIRTEGSR